jgi:hypothetical protein
VFWKGLLGVALLRAARGWGVDCNRVDSWINESHARLLRRNHRRALGAGWRPVFAEKTCALVRTDPVHAVFSDSRRAQVISPECYGVRSHHRCHGGAVWAYQRQQQPCLVHRTSHGNILLQGTGRSQNREDGSRMSFVLFCFVLIQTLIEA